MKNCIAEILITVLHYSYTQHTHCPRATHTVKLQWLSKFLLKSGFVIFFFLILTIKCTFFRCIQEIRLICEKKNENLKKMLHTTLIFLKLFFLSVWNTCIKFHMNTYMYNGENLISSFLKKKISKEVLVDWCQLKYYNTIWIRTENIVV